MPTKKKNSKLCESIEGILSAIIDEWYSRVSGYYVTQEDGEENPDSAEPVQLKRFHDSTGHRIKFNKDDLDFTYGLKSEWDSAAVTIEISVNNKVENFDYEDFSKQLFDHYKRNGERKVGSPAAIKTLLFKEVFQLESEISEAFRVEKRSNRADIMRLSFTIGEDVVKALANNGTATKRLIENYCVSPFRSIYAKVYRSSS
jgi:hypothetical protein